MQLFSLSVTSAPWRIAQIQRMNVHDMTSYDTFLRRVFRLHLFEYVSDLWSTIPSSLMLLLCGSCYCISADPGQRKECAREEEFSYHSLLLLHWQASRSSSRYMVSVLLLLLLLFSLGFRRDVRQVFRSDSGFVRAVLFCRREMFFLLLFFSSFSFWFQKGRQALFSL